MDSGCLSLCSRLQGGCEGGFRPLSAPVLQTSNSSDEEGQGWAGEGAFCLVFSIVGKRIVSLAGTVAQLPCLLDKREEAPKGKLPTGPGLPPEDLRESS